jgi:aconitase A
MPRPVQVWEDNVKALAKWAAQGGQNPRGIAYLCPPNIAGFTGATTVSDLAAIRNALVSLGGVAEQINPLNPVDLAIDYSVMIDKLGNPRAFQIKGTMNTNVTWSARPLWNGAKVPLTISVLCP